MGGKVLVSRFPEARMRAMEGTSQTRFWSRYGVTQSAGSRYENNCLLPRSLAMLIWLHRQQLVSDGDLAKALAATDGTRAKRKRRKEYL